MGWARPRTQMSAARCIDAPRPSRCSTILLPRRLVACRTRCVIDPSVRRDALPMRLPCVPRCPSASSLWESCPREAPWPSSGGGKPRRQTTTSRSTPWSAARHQADRPLNSHPARGRGRSDAPPASRCDPNRAATPVDSSFPSIPRQVWARLRCALASSAAARPFQASRLPPFTMGVAGGQREGRHCVGQIGENLLSNVR